MFVVTRAALRHQSRRFLAPAIAIVLGVAFAAVTLTLNASLKASVLTGLTGPVREYAAVVLPGEHGQVNAQSLRTAQNTPGVSSVRAVRSGAAQLPSLPNQPFVVLASVPASGSLARLEAGRWPQGAGEVAVSRAVVDATRLELNASVPIRGLTGANGTARVVGLVDAGRDPQYAGFAPIVFATTEQIGAWSGTEGYHELDVSAEHNVSPELIRDRLAAALGPQVVVRTGTEHATALVQRLSGGTDILTGVLLGFAAISLFVAALVIANTFAVLHARRARETALLRCLGAGRAQLRRSGAAEAATLGLLASAAGVLVGVATSAGLVSWSDAAGSRFGITQVAVPWETLGWPVAVGTAITVLAALGPIRRASRVTPVEALRPAGPLSASTRPGRVRLVGGIALLVLGLVLLGVGVALPQLLAGVAGGMLSFLGLLLLGSLIIPQAIRVIGWPLRRFGGVSGQLAVENAVRAPARAAATVNALLVGVTLVTTLSVGALTSQSSLEADLASRLPLDLAVTASSGTMPLPVITELGRLPGVEASVGLTRTTIQIGASDPVEVTGVPSAATSITRDPATLSGLDNGNLLIGKELARSLSLVDQQHVSVRAGERTLSLRVVRQNRATALVSSPTEEAAMMTADDLTRLLPSAQPRTVWLRVADDADLNRLIESVRSTTGSLQGVVIDGSAPTKQQLRGAVSIVLWVVTGLVGVSVLIALIGVGNTLSLSVLERTQESALLRALGLTRPGLRRTLIIEALLLAAVGAAAGTVLGLGYGWAGARCLLGGSGPIRLDIPVARLASFAAVAIAAGGLACLLPARRAAMVAPARALAVE